MSYKSLVSHCTANKQRNGGKPVSYMYSWENGSISTIILLDTFAVTLHEGRRVCLLRHEHDECEILKNVASFVQKTQVIVTYLKGKGLNCCAKKRCEIY